MPKPSSTKALIDQYCSFMEEIKLRTEAVFQILALGQNGQIDLIPAAESGYLQLRKICELIALGCLAAHADIPETWQTKFRKEWSAANIVKRLEKLHGDFFPVPSKQVLDETGRPSRVEPVTEGYLSKQDLLELYGICGDFVHRGHLRGASSYLKRIDVDLLSIQSWLRKIVALLNHHQIALVDGEYELWVLMNEKDSGRVSWAEMKKVPI